MHRSKRIFALYAELCDFAGDEHAPRVLMACAESLEELANGSIDDPVFSDRVGGVPLTERGVDRVLNEAGWALAESDNWDDDPSADSADLVNVREMLRYLGAHVYV